MYTEIIPDLYRIDTGKPSSLSYLIKTEDRNVLIDPGVVEHLEFLLNDLEAIGVESEEIDLVINTHDHLTISVQTSTFRSTLSSQPTATQRQRSYLPMTRY